MNPNSSTLPLSLDNKKAPFGRRQLELAGFFFGPLGAAVLGIANWRRFGLGENTVATFLWTLAILVTLNLLITFLAWFSPLLSATWFPLLVNATCGLLWGLQIARQQALYYQSWVTANGGTEPTLEQRGGCVRWLILLIGGVFIYSVLFQLIIVPLEENFLYPTVRSVAASLTPAQTFSNASFEITYPGSWIPYDPTIGNAQVADLCKVVQCIATFATKQPPDATIMLIEFDVPDPGTLGLQKVVDGMASQLSDRQHSEAITLTVGGQPAMQQTYYLPSPQGELREFFTFILQPDGKVMRIEAISLRNRAIMREEEIDTIIQSIRFK